MRKIKIGPRYDVEGPTDVGLGFTLETHRRRINGKTFMFLRVKSPSGSVTIHASEEISYNETKHSVYMKPNGV
jgi:hypothetical protein